MSEMTQEEIAARIEQINRELEELEESQAVDESEAAEPEDLDKRLRRVETAHERLKQSLAALEHEADRLSRVARAN